MTEAEQDIADLDAALAADGETIELQRLLGTQLIPVKVTCRAFVRGYAPNELIGGITQQDSKVIISPTEITRAGWPGPQTPPFTNQDRRVPKKNDRAIIAGKPRSVEASVGFYVGGILVRIEMRVLG